MEIVQIVLLYAFLGGSIKFIDQAYDEKVYSIMAANMVAIFSGVIGGYLMAMDSPFSTAFFTAMLISLLLANKIDNIAFAMVVLSTIITFIVIYPIADVSWILIPIAIFLVAGFVDEVGDGFAERHHIQGFMGMFLWYRPFSDIALVAMIAIGWFNILYLLPYFAFTVAYMFVEWYSNREYSIVDGMVWIKTRVLHRGNVSK